MIRPMLSSTPSGEGTIPTTVELSTSWRLSTSWMSSCNWRASQQSQLTNSISSSKSSMRMEMVRLRRERWPTSSEGSSKARLLSSSNREQWTRSHLSSRLQCSSKRMRNSNSKWVFSRDLSKTVQTPFQILRTFLTKHSIMTWKPDSDSLVTSTTGSNSETSWMETRSSITCKTFKSSWKLD